MALDPDAIAKFAGTAPDQQKNAPAQSGGLNPDAIAKFVGVQQADQTQPQAQPRVVSFGQGQTLDYGPPDTNAGRLAGSDAFVAGFGKGIKDTLITGPAQLVRHGIAEIMPSGGFWDMENAVQDERIRQAQQQFNQQTQGSGAAAGTGQAIGGAASSLLIPASRAAEGASLVSQALAAGKTGVMLGALQPVTNTDSSFLGAKAAQAGVGGLGGILGFGIGKGVGAVLGGAYDRLSGAWKSLVGTAPQITGNPELDAKIATASPALQQAVQSAAKSGKNIDPTALANQVEADSLPIPIQMTAGQAKGDPIMISMERNTRSTNPAVVQRLNEQNGALVQNLDHVSNTSAPNVALPDHIAAGESLIGSLQNVLDTQKANTSALYKKLADANGGALPLDGQQFAIDANKALGANYKAAFLPSSVQSILSDLQTGKQPMTYENFENLRTILGNEARKASSNGDGNAAAAIGTVRDTLENMEIPSSLSSIKPLADAARTSAKTGFDMVRSSPALAAVEKGDVNPNTFLQKYVVGQQVSPQQLANTVSVLQNDPAALETLRAGTVNYLKNLAVGQTGNFSQAAYNKGLQGLGPKIDILFDAPEADTLRTVGSVARKLQVQPTGSFVNNSNTDVANLARTGGSVLAGAVDTLTRTPLGSWTKAGIENVMAKKEGATALNAMLGPGAGVAAPAENAVSNRIGKAATAAGTALSSIAAAQQIH